MNSDPGSATNLGSAMRDGVVLTAPEAVGLIHEVCRQIQDGLATAIPANPSEITVTEGGIVLNHATGRTTHPGPAVASLLDALLPATATAPAAVPPALRSLSSRLRESTAQNRAALKDLLVILKWHLPDEPKQVLQQLAYRLAFSASAPVADAFVDQFEDAAPAVATTPVVAITPAVAPTPVVVPVASVRPIHTTPLDDDLPLHEPLPGAIAVNTQPPAAWRPIAAPRACHANRALAALAAALLIALSGYVGYLATAERSPAAEPAAPVARDEAPQPGAARVVAAPQFQSPDTPKAQSQPPEPPLAGVEPRVSLASPRTQPLPLDVTGGAFSPSFSADGTALYFHSGRDAGRLLQTVLTDRNTSPVLTSVLNDPGHNFHARPSPDGRWIAFDSDRDGTRGVYVMARDGSNLHRVSESGFAAVPSWSPDMKWLAFVRGEPSRPRVWNLWLRDLSSGALKRISNFRSGQVWSASWFPHARAICYSHEDRLIVTDVVSGTSQTFLTPVRGRLARTPAVSPDGSRVVFQVLGDGVWMLDIHSGEMRRLLDDGSAEEFAWDPQGRRVAYHSRRDGQWRIWVMTL